MGGTTVKGDEPDAPPKIVRQCSLEKPTQELVRMIFDNDMFNNAMQKLELGKLCVTGCSLRGWMRGSVWRNVEYR